MQSQGSNERSETAWQLGLREEELDYLGDDESTASEATPTEDLPAGDEEVPEIEIAAAESRGLVVPNRISYGVYLQRAGFDGPSVLWKWLPVGDNCVRGEWFFMWNSSINRFERSGWCRRPQTDSYDIRHKIYWRA